MRAVSTTKTTIDRTLGVETTYEEQDGQVSFNTVQDVEPILDYTRRLRSEGRRFESKSCRHVATIPLVVMEIWEREDPSIMRDRRKLRKKLDDPEWKYLKVSDSRPPSWATRTSSKDATAKIARARLDNIGGINQAVSKAGLTPIRV